jgi:hypothetical protein
MLYSVYSFPNMILPLFGGVFVDKYGTNLTLFVFCALITAGQVQCGTLEMPAIRLVSDIVARPRLRSKS